MLLWRPGRVRGAVRNPSLPPLLMAVCGLLCDPSAQAQESAPASHPVSPPTVRQAWASSGGTYDNTDSLATCHDPAGRVLLLATAKKGNRLDVFEAQTGRHLGSFGMAGTRRGQLQRPNGVVTVDFQNVQQASAGRPESRQEFVLVIERDNHRIQAFRPGSWECLGIFAEASLTKPYGGAVSYDNGEAFLYVTENDVPPGKTIKVFRLRFDARQATGEFVRDLGDAEGPGAIHKPESIAVDDRLDRVLICEEAPGRKGVRVYTRAGKFTGQIFGQTEVVGDPEGIVVMDQPGDGVVMLTDQQPTITIWHAFDRRTLQHMGCWTGEPVITNTDGICVYEGRLGPFVLGALFAVNDDKDIRGYDLRSVLKAVVQQGGVTQVKTLRPPG
jgi:3-phytase